MIQSFADLCTEEIYHGVNSKRARKKLPRALLTIAIRKLDMLDTAIDLNDLSIPPANRLEALKGNYKGKHSIRINNQYRIIFFWTSNGPEQVEIIDYH